MKNPIFLFQIVCHCSRTLLINFKSKLLYIGLFSLFILSCWTSGRLFEPPEGSCDWLYRGQTSWLCSCEGCTFHLSTESVPTVCTRNFSNPWMLLFGCWHFAVFLMILENWNVLAFACWTSQDSFSSRGSPEMLLGCSGCVAESLRQGAPVERSGLFIYSLSRVTRELPSL